MTTSTQSMIRFSLILIFSFLSAVCSAQMIEICDDGIDNDGDGLIDLNDDDCTCISTIPSGLIPNPSFEDYIQCPTTENDLTGYAVDWIQASAATSDFVHTCAGFLGNPFANNAMAPLPFPDGEGAIGFRDGNLGRPQFKEYVGSQLIAPMQPGVTYKLDFFVGFHDHPSSREISMSVFLTDDGSLLPFGGNDTEFGCPTNGPGWDQVGEMPVMGVDEWVRVEFTFTPTKAYEAIVLGPGCDPHPLWADQPYFFVDRLALAESSQFDIPFSISGDICEGPVTLSVQDTAMSYQWYLDGVALAGETNNSLSVDATSPQGEYQVVVTTEDDCFFSQTYLLDGSQTVEAFIEDEICQGDFYQFGSNVYTTTGTYMETFPSSTGCDSIVTLDLTVLPTNEVVTNAMICPGESYTWEGQQYTVTGTYSIPVMGSDCEQLVLNLNVTETPVVYPSSSEICNGESVVIGPFTVTTAGLYEHTIARPGCDSIASVTVSVLDNSFTTVDASICTNDSYVLNGQTYTMPGTYTQVLENTVGCDSTITLQVSTLPAVTDNISASICQGESYTLNGTSYTMAGTYSQTLMTASGCDSILNLQLTVAAPAMGFVSNSFCQGGSYTLNGVTYDMSGSYTQTLTSVTGCDSILTLSLQVDPPLTEWISAFFCENDTYVLNGMSYTSAGSYTQNLSTADGCDSILIAELTMIPSTESAVDATFCEGESYSLNGETFSDPGTYTQTLVSASGCDSLVTLRLQKLDNQTIDIVEEICEGGSVVINGVNYSSAGNYSQEDKENCLAYSISISENPIVDTCQFVSIFEGESITINGEVFSVAGSYNQVLQSQAGCDSLVTIKLEVLPRPLTLVHYDMNVCIAGGSSYDEFTPVYDDSLNCAAITASILERPSGFSHSCTPGAMSNGMCISSLTTCEYVPDSPHRIVFEAEINPQEGPLVLSGLQFYEKAPIMYQWNIGTVGINDYPTRYGIRILKDGEMIYNQTDIATEREWNLERFDFRNEAGFVFAEAGTIRIELLSYCTIGEQTTVSAWDLDELSLMGYCQEGMMEVTGNITTSRDKPLSSAELRINKDTEWISVETDAEGKFSFDARQNQTAVLIEAYKNDDPMNGISTLDLIHIQQHILGAVPFDEFEDFVAADVNKDDRINGMDLIELRKMVLGIYDGFPENTSWRFLNGAIAYSELEEVRDQFVVQDLQSKISIEAVKVGDLDQDHYLGVEGDDLNKRSGNSFALELRQDKIDGVDTWTVMATEELSIKGLQLELELNGQQVQKLLAGSLPLTVTHMHIVNDKLRISWFDEQLSLSPGGVLFQLESKAKRKGQISLSNEYANEMYQSEDLSVRPLVITQAETTSVLIEDSIFTTLDPNPLVIQSTLSFETETASEITINIMSIDGQLVQSKKISTVTGRNVLDLKRSEFTATGIYYIQLVNQDRNIVKKLMVL